MRSRVPRAGVLHVCHVQREDGRCTRDVALCPRHHALPAALGKMALLYSEANGERKKKIERNAEYITQQFKQHARNGCASPLPISSNSSSRLRGGSIPAVCPTALWLCGSGQRPHEARRSGQAPVRKSNNSFRSFYRPREIEGKRCRGRQNNPSTRNPILSGTLLRVGCSLEGKAKFDNIPSRPCVSIRAAFNLFLPFPVFFDSRLSVSSACIVHTYLFSSSS